ncbi:hypothetical protein BDC45DRAFT_536713 [Circinella umbellata]|nr:hypothetical protein BDC45DRAFT_536713 [Circinella umbellata]
MSQPFDIMALKTIKTRIINRRYAWSQKPLTNDHAIWQAFTEEHYTCLDALLRAPLTFNPRNYANVLRLGDQRSGPEDNQGPNNTHLTGIPRYYSWQVCQKNKIEFPGVTMRVHSQQHLSWFRTKYHLCKKWGAVMSTNEWFLHAKTGKDMQYSANAFGNDPTRYLDEEGKEDYLKKRKLGIYGAHANVEKN